MSFEFVKLIDIHGHKAGVMAEYGPRFLGLSWASMAVLLVGSLVRLLGGGGGGGKPAKAEPPPDDGEKGPEE